MEFITNHGKSYSTLAEYKSRLEHFSQKDVLINAHNATESTYTLGHNKMSDWTQDEYEAILTYTSQGNPNTEEPTHNAYAASSPIDYRTGSCLSPVQDQGQCG